MKISRIMILISALAITPTFAFESNSAQTEIQFYEHWNYLSNHLKVAHS